MSFVRWPAAWVLGAAIAGGSPISALAAAHVEFAYASAAFTEDQRCDPARPVAFINVLVSNAGDAPSAVRTLEASDDRGLLAGQATVASMPAGAPVRPIAIPLRRVAANTTIGGTYTINVALGQRHLKPIAVLFPPVLCATPAPARSAMPAASAMPAGSATITPHAAGLAALQRASVVVTPAPKPKFVETSATRIAASSQINLAAPVNVHGANGYQECAAHVGVIGALICPDMVKNGNILLVWDWSGAASGPNATIDGYRVYRVDGGRKNLVDTVANKKDQTLSNVPKPAGGYSGTCYAATAYAGARESAFSDPFCASGGSAATTVRLPASHVRSTAQTRRNFGTTTPDSGLLVGFEYFADKELLGDNWANRIHRAAIAFDVSGLLNHRLVRATLRFTIESSYGAGNNHSCTTDIDSGTEFWWTSWGWLVSGHDGGGANAGYQIEPGETGPEISADVTRVVAPWLSGAPNYGFVLKNRDENLGAFTNKSCLTAYTNPTLELTYY